jgi:hypothetical protein
MTFTLEELRALPEWEGFGSTIRERNGQRIRVITPMRPLVGFFVGDETPMGWTEPDGTHWLLARYADGQWCKRRKL